MRIVQEYLLSAIILLSVGSLAGCLPAAVLVLADGDIADGVEFDLHRLGVADIIKLVEAGAPDGAPLDDEAGRRRLKEFLGEPRALLVKRFLVEESQGDGSWKTMWDVRGIHPLATIEYGGQYDGLAEVAAAQPLSKDKQYRVQAWILDAAPAWPGGNEASFHFDAEGRVKLSDKPPPMTTAADLDNAHCESLPGAAAPAAGEQGLAGLRAAQEGPAGEMIFIPGGDFRMGLDKKWAHNSAPAHDVTVPSFWLGKYEVTFAQWDACAAAGGCNGYRPDDEGWGRGDRPVVNVSWDETQGFIDWLNAETGGAYRLPTEAEWEYAARGGPATEYLWGSNRNKETMANCLSCGIDRMEASMLPVGSFPASGWCLHDMAGNAAEWVQDCWNENYQGAPDDGSAWAGGNCDLRVLRGGGWFTWLLEPTERDRLDRLLRYSGIGFRLARDS